jgi:hypothetical protein
MQTNPKLAKAAPRLMVTRGGMIHTECPDCRGFCTPYEAPQPVAKQEAAELSADGLKSARLKEIANHLPYIPQARKELRQHADWLGSCPVSPQRLRDIAADSEICRALPDTMIADLRKLARWLERGRV